MDRVYFDGRVEVHLRYESKWTFLDNLPSIDLTDLNSSQVSICSGARTKYYDPGKDRFIKFPIRLQGVYWKNAICEELAYHVGGLLGFDVLESKVHRVDKSFDDLSMDSLFARLCSVSDNMLKPDEVLITFEELLLASGVSLDIKLKQKSVMGRFNHLIVTVQNFTGLDVTSYLTQVVILDYLMGNENRTLDNLAIAFNPVKREFRLLPISSNGASLFETCMKYIDLPVDKRASHIDGKPFARDLKAVALQLTDVFKVDLPQCISLSGLMFPSINALVYFSSAADTLGIQVSKDGVNILG